MARLKRGIRNNNPGNIRISENQWRGKLPVDKSVEDEFERFKTMELGIRALMINVRTYMNRDGLNTIEKIMHKWAPPSDNNPTEAYIEYVSKETGVDAKRIVKFEKPFIVKLAKALCEFENGKSDLFTKNLFERAWNLV